MSNRHCSGCGCEIGSGVLWLPPTPNAWDTALICCNKRCLNRAQRLYEAQRTGARVPRRAKLAGQPIEPEVDWSSLSQDVLSQVASHLAATDLLSAALTCKHWQRQLTQGVTHLTLRVDDATLTPAGAPVRRGAGEECGVVRSATCLLPQVCTLDLTVFSKCCNEAVLLRTLRSLTCWRQLRHLRIGWDFPPPSPPPSPPPPRHRGRSHGRHPQGSRGRHRGRRRSPARRGGSSDGGSSSHDSRSVAWVRPGAKDSVLCPMGFGTLGLLTALESLSIAANFVGLPHGAGLFGLSSLERLTALELLQAAEPSQGFKPERYYPWSARDADLAALDRLVSLRISGHLLSPALLSGLTHLTRLVIEDLHLASYGGFYVEDQYHYCVADALAEQLVKLRDLRLLEIGVGDEEGVHESPRQVHEFTWGLKALVSGMKQLTEAQMQQQQQQAQSQPQQPQSGESRRRRRRRHPAGRPVAYGGAAAAATVVAAAAVAVPPSPVKVELRLSRTRALQAANGVGIDRRPLDRGGVGSDVTNDGGGGGNGGGGGGFLPFVGLEDELLDELSGVVGLRRLDLRFKVGSSGAFHRLGQLTNLSYLGLRCGPDCEPVLGHGDLGVLASLPRLRTLVLELPATCLTAAVLSSSLELAAEVRELELHAAPHVTKVPCNRWEVRTRLLRAGGVGGEVEGGGSGGGGDVSAEVLEAVGAVLQPLMFLQQLIMSMPLRHVRLALQHEMEWRQQQQQLQQERAAAAQHRLMQLRIRQLRWRLTQLLRHVKQQLESEEGLEGGLEEDEEQGDGEEQQQRRRWHGIAEAQGQEQQPGQEEQQQQQQWLALLEQLGDVLGQLYVMNVDLREDTSPPLRRLYGRTLYLLRQYLNNPTDDARPDGQSPQQVHGEQEEQAQQQEQQDRAEEGEAAVSQLRDKGPLDQTENVDKSEDEGDAGVLGELPLTLNPAARAPALAPAAAAAVAAAAASGPTVRQWTGFREAVNDVIDAMGPDPVAPPADAVADVDAGADAAAGDMPTLAAWVLRIHDDDGDGYGAGRQDITATTSNAPGLAGIDGGGDAAAATASPVNAVAMSAVHIERPLRAAVSGSHQPGPPPIPLQDLTLEQLARLRPLLVRKELVVGPTFRLGYWSPPKLEVLRLRGFAGLDFARRWFGNRGAEAYMPYLRVLDVITVDEAAAAATRREVEEWAAPAEGRAPWLEEVTVTAAAATAAVAAALGSDDDDLG